MTFTIAEVAAAAGATPGQVAAWISRGFLVPDSAAPPGIGRRFTPDDLRRATVLGRLARHALPLSAAARLMPPGDKWQGFLAVWRENDDWASAVINADDLPKLANRQDIKGFVAIKLYDI